MELKAVQHGAAAAGCPSRAHPRCRLGLDLLTLRYDGLDVSVRSSLASVCGVRPAISPVKKECSAALLDVRGAAQGASTARGGARAGTPSIVLQNASQALSAPQEPPSAASAGFCPGQNTPCFPPEPVFSPKAKDALLRALHGGHTGPPRRAKGGT